MVSLTPSFSLPYPSASDEPCDFAEQWCDFTEAIDDVFTTFETGINRTTPIVPAAKFLRTTPISVLNLAPIPFDTAEVDTAGMIDISTDPFHITYTRAGRYTLCAYLDLLPPGTALNAEISIIIGGDLRTATAETINRGVGIIYRLNVYRAVYSAQAGEQSYLSFNTGTAGSYTVNKAWLSAVWHSDTETP